MKTNLQHSVQINSSYAELLPSFNDDLQSAVDAALQRYLIDEIAAKIAGLKKKKNCFGWVLVSHLLRLSETISKKRSRLRLNSI